MFVRQPDATTTPSIDLFRVAAERVKTLLQMTGGNRNISSFISEDAVIACVQSGNIDLVHYIFKSFRIEIKHQTTWKLVDLAATNGSADILEFMAKHFGIKSTVQVHFDQVAQHGHINVFQYFAESETPVNIGKAFVGHSYSPYISASHYLSSVGSITENTMTMAAVGGHLDLVQYLHTTRKEGPTPDIFLRVIQNNKLQMADYLFSHNIGINLRHLIMAIVWAVNAQTRDKSLDTIHYLFKLIRQTNCLDPITIFRLLVGRQALSPHYTIEYKKAYRRLSTISIPSDNNNIDSMTNIFQFDNYIPKLSFNNL
eukprot:gene19439-23278_t